MEDVLNTICDRGAQCEHSKFWALAENRASINYGSECNDLATPQEAQMKTSLKSISTAMITSAWLTIPLISAAPASAYTSYLGGGAATFERVARNAGLVPSWSQPDGNRAREFLKKQAASTAATQAGRLWGLGRNAGWLGIGVKLLDPKVAE